MATWPEYNEEYITEKSFNYPVCINNKKKMSIDINNVLSKEDIEHLISEHEKIREIINDKSIKKIIVVMNRMINIVI